MPDGRLLVISARDGSLRPWIVDPEGKAAPVLVPLATTPSDAGVSADGRRLVFMTTKGLLLADVAGSSAGRYLTDNPTDTAPSFWRNDEEIVFSRPSGDEQVIFTLKVEGGEPVPVGPKGSNVTPIPGTDDLLFLEDVGKQNRPMVWSGATRSARPLAPELREGFYGRADISPDKKTVVFTARGVEVVFVDFASGRVLRTAGKGGDQLARPFFDVRGRVFVARSRWVGDIWLAELGEPGG
jgi:dipeptidyl aminopeptidase/acylaminoacyl peptidase